MLGSLVEIANLKLVHQRYFLEMIDNPHHHVESSRLHESVEEHAVDLLILDHLLEIKGVSVESRNSY